MREWNKDYHFSIYLSRGTRIPKPASRAFRDRNRLSTPCPQGAECATCGTSGKRALLVLVSFAKALSALLPRR